eukprot:TRINITY_DN1833_c0_g1_i2.p1 TRINITY_DN1833_c0_g1~~TRINITY_DN1833_c0_g1_i2.p1  ORF type:complete len:204 (+),score=36.61 TRINITY_DN1833_c0_g1_i2:41-652(+)
MTVLFSFLMCQSFFCYLVFFFFNDTATTEIYTRSIVGSVRCVQETGDNMLLFWDIREKKNVGWIKGPHMCGDAMDVRGDTLLTGSYTYTEVLQLWSVSERKLIQTLDWDSLGAEGGKGFLYTARFDRRFKGEQLFLAGGAGINELRVFSCQKDYPLQAQILLPNTVTSSDFAYSINMFAVGCADGKGRLFAFDNPKFKQSLND